MVAELREELREEAIWRHRFAQEEQCLRDELKETLNELTEKVRSSHKNAKMDLQTTNTEHAAAASSTRA